MRQGFLTTLLFSVLGLLAACATPLPEPVDSGQLVFWEVRPAEGAGDTTVMHLLGSVHLGKSPTDFDPAIHAQLSQATLLVYEIAPGAMDQKRIAATLLDLGMFDDGQTLPGLLSARTWSALQNRLARAGLPAANLVTFEPWVALFQLLGLSLAEAKMNPEHGVEVQINKLTAGAPAIGLETVDYQLELFDQLPMETQIYLLEDALESEAESVASINRILAAWQAGDLDLLESLISPATDDPQLEIFHERVFLRRNHNMAEGLADLLEKPGRYFVTLGTGHTLGSEGIPALLGKQGLRVRRIPRTRATP